jgi:hypothetical protein
VSDVAEEQLNLFLLQLDLPIMDNVSPDLDCFLTDPQHLAGDIVRRQEDGKK